MKKVLLVLALAMAALLPMNAYAAEHGRVIAVRPFFGGWYDPMLAGPYGLYWGPYGYWGLPPVVGPQTGEIKLDTKVKDAQVFVNGNYAGTTHDTKTMRLRPGGYKIEIRESGQDPFVANVYVQAGKTMHLHPDL